jgi:hypothetical protein
MSVSLQVSILAAVKHALQNLRKFEEEEENTGEGGKAGNRKRKNM